MAFQRLVLSSLVSTFLCMYSPATGSIAGFEVPSATAISRFDQYAGRLGSRVTDPRQADLLSLIDTNSTNKLRDGELIIDKLTPEGDPAPSALLHHWRGRAFVQGGKVDDFTRLLRDFDNYPKIFSPQVERAAMLTRQGDRLQATMRVRQKHVITVVMDATYDVSFGRSNAKQAYSVSRSTKITEISSPGTLLKKL